MSRPKVYTSRSTSGWWVVAACSISVLFGLRGSGAFAQPTPAASVSASASAPPAASATAAPSAATPSAPRAEASASPTTAPSSTAAPIAAPAHSHGMSAIAGDAAIPLEWLPPGSKVSPLPSDEIFPPQQLTIRFNHKKHVQGEKQTCKSCHSGAYTSTDAGDSLLPKPTETCDNCHYTDHSNLKNVTGDTDPISQCTFCHLGENAGAQGKVAQLVIPKPNLRFPHKKHLDRNVQCGHCHGKIEEVELATRDFLPRMAGCYACHQMSGAAQGDAKGDCDTCHIAEPSGKLTTSFGAGMLLPPAWLHNAAHTADWIERHKSVAANDSAFCGSCHANNFCTDCHDGRVRNRKVHPNDWLSMHPQAARQDNPRCTSCHAEQTFCGDCHRRVGVARDSASGNRPEGRRFHPPAATWTTGPRSSMHHSWEAERNLNACVSCHTERDCATCHATKGVSGGQGVNPHPVGFANGCASAFQRNPRPCLVCHQSSDAILRTCK
ncbi:MAG: cytochrome c family protein [Polyangiaceae bacterium]|nr:cytochrome c family protein [Polyangiaceae bacterium]